MQQQLRQHSKYLVLIIVLVGALFASTHTGARASGASISLSVSSGPPTTQVQVYGAGFGFSEQIIIDFDTTQVGTATTDGSGTFSLSITVPASAQPGPHSIQATGQTSGLTALSPFLVQTNWEQVGFDAAHTGYNPYENTVNVSNVSGLTLGWFYKTVNTHFTDSPVVANGLLYVATSNGTLIALKVATGMLYWSYPNIGSVYISPIVTNGIVYTSSTDGNVYALDAATGAFLWKYFIGTSFYPALTVANGVLYVSAGQIYALNATTGALLWQYSNSSCCSDPVISEGVIYINANSGLYALNATTGTELWNAPFNGYALVVAPPNLYDVVGSGLDAINIKSHRLQWRYAINTDDYMTIPAVVGSIVYINTTHRLIAVNAHGGKPLWTFGKGGFKRGATLASPVIANGVVYVDFFSGANDWISALNATTGVKLWQYYENRGQRAFPVMVNGVLYVGSDKVYAFHL